MCREQGLRITSDLARMTLPKDRNVDYTRLAHEMTSSEMVKLELLTDEHSYTALVQDFNLSLQEYIECKKSGDSERRLALRKFFMPPGVFDGLVNVLVQQLTKKPMRPHLCDAQARLALID